ncbi:MAG: hypothetical protein IT260_20060, partial [Saprospiraceae bacterium]|nr:hypothetical protein [Saprospiraceae bacterium]
FDGPFKAFDDITEVRAERDLEDAITKFCGLLAVRNRKWQFAQKWMNKMKEKTEGDQAISEWLDKRSPN